MSRRAPPETDTAAGDWLSALADRWPVTKVRFVARLESGHTPSRQKEEYWVPEECVIPWFSLADVWQIREAGRVYLEETAEKVSEAGVANSSARLLPTATVILSRTASVGFSGILAVPMATSQDFVGWVCGPSLRPEFLLYILRAMRPEFARLMMGSTHQTIYMPDIHDLRTPVPPLDDQDRIVAFLDRETARIDALIAAKERLLAVLEEKRAALITHAVTKGLDPTAPMKPAHVPWLDEVPAHWKIMPLKFAAVSLQTGPFGSELHAEDYIIGGTPVVNPTHLNAGSICPDDRISVEEATAERLAMHRLCSGDIVFARRGQLGRCAVVEQAQSGWLCGTGSLRVRLKADLAQPYYVAFLFAYTRISDVLGLESVGSTMENINTRVLGSCHVILPSLNEQFAIVAYVQTEIAKLDSLDALTRRSIDLLRERREALITAAVLGRVSIADSTGTEPLAKVLA